MKIAVFSARAYDQHYFERCGGSHKWMYFRDHLRPETVRLAKGCEVACVFVNDRVDRDIAKALAARGVRHLDMPATPGRVYAALRAAPGRC